MVSKKMVCPLLLGVIVCIQLILAFYGPLAFRKKVSIMISLPFSDHLSEIETTRLRTYIEKMLAESGEFRIYSHELIENYYAEQEDRADFAITDSLTYKDYLTIAEHLDLQQAGIVTAFSNGSTIRISLIIRDVRDQKELYNLTYYCDSIERFMEGQTIKPIDERGRTEFKLSKELKNRAGGVEAFDYIFFLILAGQIVLALLLLTGNPWDILNQVLLSTGLILFLFSFIYAQNAGLDYVQRFIAAGGQIKLANDTWTEQMYAALRFLPMLLVNLYLYGSIRLSMMRQKGSQEGVITRTTRHWGLVLSIFSAFLFTAAFPSFISLKGIPILAWVCLIPLFLAVLNSEAVPAALYVVCFGAFSTLLLNYWHGTFSYVSLAFTVGLSSLLWIVFAAIFVPGVKFCGKWGFITAAVLWVLFEYTRTIGYIGYPWGLIGVSQYSQTSLIQMAELTGVLGISLLVLLVNAAAAWFIAGNSHRWSYKPSNSVLILGALLLLLLAHGYGFLVMYIDSRDTPQKSIRIALMQPNTDPRKHDYRQSFTTLTKLTKEAITESGEIPIDLIVWPEGGFKPDIRYYRDRSNIVYGNASLVKEFDAFLSENNIWLLTGSQDHIYETDNKGEKKRRNFNSSYFMRPGGAIDSIYHKIHLVPFTEHFPYKDELPWVADLLDKFNTSNWKQGKDRHLFNHPKAAFFTPICFEDIFPGDIRQFAAQNADLIVNISNDYWSLTPVEGKQHAVHALFRSVENNIPTVRSTASGRTAYIDRHGKLLHEHPGYYTEGYLLIDVPIFGKRATLYQKYGDWIIFLSLAVWAGIHISILIGSRIKGDREKAPGLY